MQNFHQKVQFFLKKHRKQKRYAVIAVLLSFVVIFSVCGSLIMPAVSMTGSMEETAPMFEMAEADTVSLVGESDTNSAQNDPRKPANSSGWFDSTVADPPEGGVDFTNRISAATITVGGQTATVPGGNASINVPASGNSIDASFSVTYTISKDGVDGNKVTLETPCIYYQLPDGVETAGFCGESRSVHDDDYDGGYAGYYSISTDGLVVIQFTDAYIQNKIMKSDSFTGTVSFNGQINRANKADGDQTITVGGITVNVDFPEKTFGIDKSYQVNAPTTATGKPTVTWTITVDNYYTNEQSLNGYQLVDARFPENKSGVTVKPSDVGEWKDGGYFEFNSTNPERTTFTFTEEITDYVGQAMTVDNTATLKDSNGTTVNEKTATAQLEKASITKDGKPDYETGTTNNEINWSVTVTNPYGSSLNGYQVQDAAFSNASNISVKDASGTDVPYTISGDTITFGNGDNRADVGEVTITYTTTNDASSGNTVDGNKVTNTATVIYPGGAGSTFTSKDVTYTNPYYLSDKTGTYNHDTGLITWTVGAHAPDNGYGYTDFNNKKVVLNNYELTDAAFANITLSQMTITAMVDWNGDNCSIMSTSDDGNTITVGKNNEVYATITKGGNTITVTAERPYTEGMDVNTVRGIRDIAFTYTTKRDEASDTIENGNGTVNVTNSSGKPAVENTVRDNQGHTKTGQVEITDRDNITKQLVSGNRSDVVYEQDITSKLKTLDWKIEVVQDTGFAVGDKALVDVMSATNGGAHYIAVDQKNSVKVYAKASQNDSYGAPLDSSAYEIKFYAIEYYENGGVNSKTEVSSTEGANSFEIVFTSAIDDANYKFVQVTYQTTADYSNVPTASGSVNQSAEFSNQASFGGASNKSSWTVTKKDKNYVETTNFSVSKSWQGDNASDRPDSITFQLQRKSGDSGVWETIYQNADNAWEVVTPDLTDESTENDYTYSLTDDGNGNWRSMTFENLDKETSDHTQLYYYRAVEINPPEGYNVSYSAENGINGGNFTITNTKPTAPTYPDFEKTAIDGSKNAVTKLNPNDLAKVDVNGKSYYAVGWKVDFIDPESVTLYDMLPEGAVLLEGYSLNETDSFTGGGLSYPAMFWNGYQWSLSGSGNSSYQVLGDGRIQFSIEPTQNSYKYIIYYIGIPVDDVDAVEATTGYTATNKMEYENGDFKEASVLITSSGSTPTETGLLDKTVNKNYGMSGDNIKAEGGRIQYSVTVNPEGKNLSNTDEYDITDALTVNGCGSLTDALHAIDAKLFNITVKNTATDQPLSTSDYQYTVEYKPTTESEIAADIGFQGENKGFWFNKAYDTVVMVIKCTGTPGGTITCGIQPQSGEISNRTTLTFDEKGEVLYTATLQSPGTIWNDIRIIEGTCSSLSLVSATTTQTTINSTAVLHLTVPDETPLEITYSYDLTKSGASWTTSDNGTEITASNSVSLDTGNVSAADSEDNTKFSISNSDSTVTTGSVPQIVKYDINDYSLKLDADFWIAKYDTDKWVFSSSDTPTTTIEEGVSITKHVFTFDKEANDDAIPEGAQSISIKADETYKAGFEPNTLYKLVEFKAPGTSGDGYQGMDAQIAAIKVPEGTTKYMTLETLIKAYLADASAFPSTSPYYSLLKNFISTHYFVYGSGSVTYPADVDTSKVIQVKTGGSLDIPNNRLISITASKTWSQNVEGTSSIKAKLYWSHTKSSKGIPADATVANAADLGLEDDQLQNPVTINTTLPEDVQGPTLSKYTWFNLPSGKDDKPVYYYVQETSYTLHTNSDVEHTSENCTGCTTYTLQDDGTYQDDDGNEGEYKPNYTGNAANKTGTVSIHNSKGLTIEKVWKNSDNTPMDADDIPVDDIDVNIYGVKADGTRDLFFTKRLSAPDWKLTLTSEDAENAGKTLSNYESIRVEEVIADDQVVSLYGYISSYTYSLNGTNGEATITNKNNAPTETSVTVNKVWGDGNDHSTDEITIKLYQSTTYLTANQLENLTADELKSMGGVELSEKKITLPISDNWTYTWDNLEYRNADKVPYNYYVLEEWSGLSGDNAYTAVYARTNSTATNTTYTITNSQSGKASVQKKWVNDAGATVSPDVDSITLQLYKRLLKTTETDDSQITGEIPSNLKVAAVGDSITNGYWSGASPFPTQLKTLLGSGATVENYGNSGEKINNQIANRVSSNTYYYTDIDVMLIMGGINDINAGDWESYSWDYSTNSAACTSKHSELQQCVKDMIQAAYNNAETSGKGKNNTAILIASIPYEDFVDESTNTVKENINYCGSLWALLQELNNGAYMAVDKGMGVTLAQAFENEINKMVDTYNKMLEDVVTNLQATYPTLRFVDINEAVNKNTMLYDGVHPNNDGYAEIAQTFYNAIATYYGASSGTGTSVTAPTGIDKLPDDFYTTDASGNPTTTVDSSKYTYVKDITLTSDNWTATFDTDADYAYYVVEAAGGSSIWTATYGNNGVTDGEIITITNTKEAEPISIQVKKEWCPTDLLDDVTLPISVQVQLYYADSATVAESTWTAVTNGEKTLTAAGGWTATWNNLDASKFYFAKEVDVPEGWTSTVTGNGTQTNNAIITITNTLDTGSLEVEKAWENDSASNRPSDVEVNIYRSTTPPDQIASTVENETQSLQRQVMLAKMATADAGIMLAGVVPAAQWTTINVDNSNCSYSGNKIIVSIPAGNYGWLTLNRDSNFLQDQSLTVTDYAFSAKSESGGTGFYSDLSSGSVTAGSSFGGFSGYWSSDFTITITVSENLGSSGGGEDTTTTSAEATTTTTTTTASVVKPDGWSELYGGNVDIPVDSTVDSIQVEVQRVDIRSDNSYFYIQVGGVNGVNIDTSGNVPVFAGNPWGGTNGATITMNNGVITISNIDSSISNITLMSNNNYFHYKYTTQYKSETTLTTTISSTMTTTTTTTTTTSTSTTTTTTDPDIPPQRVDPAVPEGGFYKKLTLTANENWKARLDNLPITDGYGHTYYYYIKEDDPGGSYIPIRYTVNNTNGNAAQLTIDETVKYQVTNYMTNTTGTTMPSTGGAGTKWYTITGIAITSGALAGNLLIRRRHKRQRMK